MKVINIRDQHFLIVDKVNGVVHKIELKPHEGVIRQVNAAYDRFLKEENHGREN